MDWTSGPKLAFTVLRSLIASRLLWWAMNIAPEDEKRAYLEGCKYIYEEGIKVSVRSYRSRTSQLREG